MSERYYCDPEKNRMNKKIIELEASDELLRECVAWYANKNNWYGKGAPFNEDKSRRMIIASIDTEGGEWVGGFKARVCLAKLGER